MVIQVHSAVKTHLSIYLKSTQFLYVKYTSIRSKSDEYTSVALWPQLWEWLQKPEQLGHRGGESSSGGLSTPATEGWRQGLWEDQHHQLSCRRLGQCYIAVLHMTHIKSAIWARKTYRSHKNSVPFQPSIQSQGLKGDRFPRHGKHWIRSLSEFPKTLFPQ